MKIKNREITKKLLLIFGGAFAVLFFVWLFLFMSDPSGSQRAVFHTDGNDWFMDWFNVVYYSIGRKPYVWGLTEERSLPPLTFLLLYPFSKLYDYDVTGWVEGETRYTARYAQFPMVAALAVFVFSYLLLFYSLYKSSRVGSDLKKAFLFLILFLSGVNLYCLDRGNLQVITAASVFLYVYLCDRDDDMGKTGIVIGCFCLAFAAALKLFPAIMGIILLYRRKWKEAFLTFVMGAALFIFPFFWMDLSFTGAVGAFFRTLGEHASSYMTTAEFGFSTPVITSLTGMSHGALQIMAYLTAVISLCTAWTLSGWKKLMLLMLTLVLTSGQQGYYCLMFLFLPIVLFFDEEHGWADVIYVFLFAVILSPLQRTAHIGAVEIPARAVINVFMLGLYIWLMAEAVRNAASVRSRGSVTE
ncbi:MAG: DUF2029 domain-containing protein [Lachnospiraceae bacterium]|nr:DUF2029 domain-containing protein [Lachnospiraceae bacterium]